jgi:hypothetical protein
MRLDAHAQASYATRRCKRVGDLLHGRSNALRVWCNDLARRPLALLLQIYLSIWRKFAEIPHNDFEAYLSSPTRKRGSRRAILVHFGKINVVADEIYEGTEIGRLARALLQPTERVLEQMNERQRFHLSHALRHRLKAIVAVTDLRSE